MASPNVVTFLAASMVGTAAPLNPAYKEEEFRFYLEDTNARFLLLPPEGAEAARLAAGDKVPVLSVDLDDAGNVRLSPDGGRAPLDADLGGRRRADPAHQRKHRTSEARAAVARQPVDLGAQRRQHLQPGRRTTCRCA